MEYFQNEILNIIFKRIEKVKIIKNPFLIIDTDTDNGKENFDTVNTTKSKRKSIASKMNIIACFKKNNKKKKDKQKDAEIAAALHNKFKSLHTEFVNDLKIMINDFSSTQKFSLLEIFPFDYYTYIYELFLHKLDYLYKEKNIEMLLKEDVDKYSVYFNIDRVILKQEREIKAQNEKLLEFENMKQSKECGVCFEKERSIVFQPCMHLLCCDNCADSFEICPSCQCKVDIRIKLSFN